MQEVEFQRTGNTETYEPLEGKRPGIAWKTGEEQVPLHRENSLARHIPQDQFQRITEESWIFQGFPLLLNYPEFVAEA